jgi:hypothetical protein
LVEYPISPPRSRARYAGSGGLQSPESQEQKAKDSAETRYLPVAVRGFLLFGFGPEPSDLAILLYAGSHPITRRIATMTPDEPPPRPTFPQLPIITLDPPPTKLTQREKYGGLFYLGIAGLVVVIVLVGRFAWEAWSLRDVWTEIYVLHDSKKPETERILAAYALSRDGRVDAQQRWDIALRKPLPPLARYLLAETLPSATAKAEPAVFAKVVANSEGWPEWLRLLCVRTMAIAASEGTNFPGDALDSLAARPDPLLRLWVDYIRSVSVDGDREAAARLQAAAAGGSASARELADAISVGSYERATHLEAATRRIRIDSPEALLLWKGWTERDGTLVSLSSL